MESAYMKINNFYCTHYSKLVNRKPILLKAFEDHSLEVIWIEDEPEILKPDNLTQEQFSSTHKHYKALQHFIGCENSNLAMVFEDDVIIENDFGDYLKKLELELDYNDFDFISVGNISLFDKMPSHGIVNPILNKLVYIENWTTTGCAHCMLFTKKFAKVCVDNFKYQHPFDNYLDFNILNTKNYKVGRTFPYIKQRTIDGNWASAMPTIYNGYGTWYGGKK